MIHDKFVEQVIAEIEGARSALANSVLSGQAGGDRYHVLTGEIRGLDRAAQIIRDLIAPTLDHGHPLKEAHDDQAKKEAGRTRRGLRY